METAVLQKPGRKILLACEGGHMDNTAGCEQPRKEKNMKQFFVAVMFLGLVLINMPASFAQEEGNDKFSFGKVVSVAADSITVKEYDFAKDADVEVTYSVTPETELGNVNAVADLKADDDIVIDYVEKDGKRVVTTLVKEEKGTETPLPAAEGDVTTAPEAAPETEEAPAPTAAPEAEVPAEVAPEQPAAAPAQ